MTNHEEAAFNPGDAGMDHPDLRSLREMLRGVTPEAAVFEDAMQQRLTEQPIEVGIAYQSEYDQYASSEAHAILDRRGLAYPSQAVPPARKLRELQESDWEDVRASDTPLLKLWSRTNTHEVERHFRSRVELYQSEVARNEHKMLPKDRQAEQALLKSLPLIHSTTFQALCAAFESGAFVSNRALRDEKNIDVTADGIGATNSIDREVGLDNYVFADYARPRSSRVGKSEVEVVLEPEAMQQKGAFVTEHDIQDFEMRTRDGQVDYRKYMGEAYTPDDLLQIVAQNLKVRDSNRISWGGRTGQIRHTMRLKDFVEGSDAQFDQTGTAHFSTFEVKVPQVPIGYTRKVVFSDPVQYETFRQRFPDIQCDMRPEPPAMDEDGQITNRISNMQLYGTLERQQQEQRQLRSNAYTKRVSDLQQAGDAREGYMILLHPAPYDSDAAMYDPNWFAANGKKYHSAEEALAAARSSRKLDPFAVLTGEVEAEARMGNAEEASIAKVSYSSADSNLTVIQGLTVESVI